jgi:proteic killer suppression protein
MIKSFRHRGLKLLFEEDDRRKLNAQDVDKISRILAALDAARAPYELNVPSWRLHPLRGDLKSMWSVTVRANWRITFRFDGEDACDVDLQDYH